MNKASSSLANQAFSGEMASGKPIKRVAGFATFLRSLQSVNKLPRLRTEYIRRLLRKKRHPWVNRNSQPPTMTQRSARLRGFMQYQAGTVTASARQVRAAIVFPM